MNNLFNKWSISKAYQSGYKCAKNSMNEHSNPYRNVNGYIQQYEAWLRGFHDFKKEHVA